MPARGRPPSLSSPLARALAAAGVSRVRAAEALGVGRVCLQERLSGRRGHRSTTWSDEQVQALAALLGVPPSQAETLLRG